MLRQRTEPKPGTRARILILENDRNTAALWAESLQRDGFLVSTLISARSWKEVLQLHAPNLIILNRRVPNCDSFELLTRTRRDKDTATLPILFVCDDDDETDQVVAFSLGADDVVVMPVSPLVLSARARLLTNRHLQKTRPVSDVEANSLQLGELKIDFRAHQVTRNGLRVDLTQSEFLVLTELAKNRGKTLRRSDLAKGLGLPPTDPVAVDKPQRRIDSHIKSLRRKLGVPGLIQTVPGSGYRISPLLDELPSNGQR